MNALVMTSEIAEDLISKQTGQHRLGPVQLTDGRYFLMEDVLSEPVFSIMLEDVNYEVLPFETIEDLLQKSDLEELE